MPCDMPAAAVSSSKMQLAMWLIALLTISGSSNAVQAEGVHGYGTDDPSRSQQSCPQALQDGRETCPLWGCQGESWTRRGLLSDWSFAGYGAGLEAIPSPPVTVDVKRDFHATGNGVTDDTAAIRAAIDATKETGGVIYFPPGKYILSDQLFLHSYQVLRGAGRDQTNLRFTHALADLRGWGKNYTAGKGRSSFTWAGAMITNQQQQGVFPATTNLHLGHVVQPAKRGDTRLYVGNLVRNTSSAELLFTPGQWCTIALAENAAGDLARMLYNNKTAGGYSLRNFARQFMLTHMTRITAVGSDWIEMERPLHVDISLKHLAVVAKSANYKVTGMGVEDLEVSFPWTAYMGHHEEAGFNAIEFIGAVNSWVRRIRIVNADSGVRLYGSLFNTISDVEITNSPWSRKGGRWVGRESVWQLTEMDGHMGIALHWASHDNLVEKFNITGTYYHDLLVAVYSSRNVFSQGRGTDICMDHHGAAPNNNLWTDIDVGLGQGAMRWSGDAGANPYAGKLNTFWGIWASTLPVKVDYVGQLAAAKASMAKMQHAARLSLFSRPADIQGYQQVVVDMPLDSSMPTIREAGDWLIHYNPDYKVWPSNLYKAMVTTAGSRLQLIPNGTFLSDMYPRPATAAAWRPVPLPHPAAARPAAVRPDPDCLNLGCQGVSNKTSWVQASLKPSERAYRFMVDHTTAVNNLPGAEAVSNLSSSILATSSSWLSAAGRATASFGGLSGSGAGGRSNSSMALGSTLSLAPVSAVASELVTTLKQVVSVASSLLATLTGGLPSAAVLLPTADTGSPVSAAAVPVAASSQAISAHYRQAWSPPGGAPAAPAASWSPKSGAGASGGAGGSQQGTQYKPMQQGPPAHPAVSGMAPTNNGPAAAGGGGGAGQPADMAKMAARPRAMLL